MTRILRTPVPDAGPVHPGHQPAQTVVTVPDQGSAIVEIVLPRQ